MGRLPGASGRLTFAAADRGTCSSFILVAERRGVQFQNIASHYNHLERTMLDEFYQFVQQHAAFRWLHWNMRDVNYGFAAIEHRYRVLGGAPVIIPDSQRTDLAWVLLDLYGADYVPHPRLPKLIERNAISTKDFLSGSEEAAAFETRAFTKLHQSTLRKVDILASIAARAWGRHTAHRCNTPEHLREYRDRPG